MGKNRGYWKPSRVVYRKRVDVPVPEMDIEDQVAVAMATKDIEYSLFMGLWKVKRFFRGLIWWKK